VIRVVLDTNILISALLSPQGPPAQIFLMTILEPDTQLCVSGEIFAEYEEVIYRPRFNRSDDDIKAALQTIRERGLWVKPTEKVHASPDPNNDIFLECAQACAAHYLITGNVKHFPTAWATTQIVTARQFLDA
jgi:putative PIN family toxin of toxin-antitoxin system